MMNYQPPRRNVSFTDAFMLTKNNEQLTIRRCYENDQPTTTMMFIDGWRVKEYKTEAGVRAFLGRVGAKPLDEEKNGDR